MMLPQHYFQQAAFLQSATTKKTLPVERGREVAFAGRSNAGKSSVINRVCSQKSLARTSKTPGRTQLINFFQLPDEHSLVDLPGYGYAKVSKTERAKWGKMIETYITEREQLQAVVSLVDMRHDPTVDDIQMYNFLKYYNIPVIVVATKCDKIKKNQWNKHESAIKKKLDFDPSDDFIVFSSETKEGKDKAWAAIEKYL